MLDTIFIGTDVSSQANVAHVMDNNGGEIFGDEFPNSTNETTEMLPEFLLNKIARINISVLVLRLPDAMEIIMPCLFEKHLCSRKFPVTSLS